MAFNDIIRLTVTTGPDKGKSKTFSSSPIQIGRNFANDFSLTDGYISNFHGRISDSKTLGYVYEDLDSRHGSLLVIPPEIAEQKSYRDNQVIDGSTLFIGCSEILVSIDAHVGFDESSAGTGSDFLPVPYYTRRNKLEALKPSALAQEPFGGSRTSTEHIIISSADMRSSVAKRLGTSDKTLDLLFELSGKLNASTDLNQILNLIVDATFDAFPSANYFSISMIDDHGELEHKPYISRLRGKVQEGRNFDQELITSRSTMERVLETHEGILCIHDDFDSQSVSSSIHMARISASMCVPLVGQHTLLGVLQVETRGRSAIFTKHELDVLTVFGSSIAFALERAQLTGNLEKIFEKFVDASVTAIEARDPTTAGHSQRVAKYTLELAQEVNLIKTGPWGKVLLASEELRELNIAALLHDFGKICVKEHVLQKSTRLPIGGLALIQQRFEFIIASFEARQLREWIDHRDHPNTNQQHHNQRISTFKAAMEEALSFVTNVNSSGYVSPEDITNLKKLAQKTYINAFGEPKPYLTEDELMNLSIARGTLNELEWIEMKSHAARSEEYLAQIPWTKDLQRIPTIAGAHHEKLDGSGYPRGLKAPEIPVQVRMLTIADIFDALTAADRPYRKAAPVEGAVKILYAEAEAGKLDLELVQVFEHRVVPKLSI